MYESTSNRSNAVSGLTRIEVLCICGTLMACLVAAWFYIINNSARVSRLSCASVLGMLHANFARFAMDHDGRYPMALSTNDGGTREYNSQTGYAYKHFSAVLSNRNFVIPEYQANCPADKRSAPAHKGEWSNTNISYFLGLDSQPGDSTLVLAGDRNVSSRVEAGVRRFKWNAADGLHGDRGYVLFGDGHVEHLIESPALDSILNSPPNKDNPIVFP